MVFRSGLTALSIFFFISPVHLNAEEFPVRIPRSFETEVLVEARYDEPFIAIQFQVTEIHFNDFANYRIRSQNATTIKPELVEGGMNLLCGENETIVLGGQVLSLTRKSDEYQGNIPTTRADLELMLEKNCRNRNWNVAFASGDGEVQKSLERLPGLAILVGSFDLLNQDKSAFVVAKSKSQSSKLESLDFSAIVNNVSHRVSIQKWREVGWRISQLESTYSNPHFVNKFSVEEKDSELKVKSHVTKNSSAPESRVTASMHGIQFDGEFPLQVTQSISNGTPVSLRDSPQIKAVWMDGKVVRVYEGGTVDDLGSATFRTSNGSYGVMKIVLITLVFAGVGGALVWFSRSGTAAK